MGDKPRFTLTARPKNDPKNKDARVKVAGAWPSTYDFNVALDKGVKEIVMNDGTRITGATHYINLKDWESPEAQQNRYQPRAGDDEDSLF